MQLKIIIISLMILVVCASGAFLLSSDATGHGTYTKNDAQKGGENLANTAEWIDWPDHTEGHGTDDLLDKDKSYWECSSTYNCSLVGTFEAPINANEIHVHGCYFKGKTNVEQYIPKDFEIWVNSTGRYEMLYRVTNNSEYSFVLPLDSEVTLSGIDIRSLYGKSGYGVGTYEFPCIEEVEVFETKGQVNLAPTVSNASPEPTITTIEPEPSIINAIWNWIRNIF